MSLSFRKTAPKYPEDCLWEMMEGKRDDRPMFVRRNITAGELRAHPDYRYRVGVAIPLISNNELGLPYDEENQQLADIEDALNVSLCGNQVSIQVLVITTGGMREFIYQTRDPKTCASQFSKIEAAIVPHQLQAYIAEDLEWSVYSQFVPNAA